MAAVDIAVLTKSFALPAGGDPAEVTFPMTKADGTAYNPTGGAFSMQYIPSAVGFNDPAFSPVSATVANIALASGVANLAINAGAGPGSYLYQLNFTPSGGTAQLVAQGSMTLQ